MNLSQILIAQGRYDEAKAEVESNLTTLHALFTEDHAYIIAARDLLGKSLIGLGEYVSAEDVFRRNVDLWRKTNGMAQRLAASLSALGEALLGQGRIAEAEEYLALASKEIDGTSQGREEEHSFREHSGRLQKLRLARDRISPSEAQFAEVNDSQHVDDE